MVFDKTLLATGGRKRAGAGQRGPGRPAQEKDALLPRLQPQGIGEELLVEAQAAAFGDELQAGGVGYLAFQQRKHPQPVPGEQPAVARVPKAPRVKHLGFDDKGRLLHAADGIQGQQQAVGFGGLGQHRTGPGQAQQ